MFAPEPDSYKAFLLDRLADQVETLHTLVAPSAAEFVACSYPGDDEAADAAIELVDARTARLRCLLGVGEVA